MSLLCRKDLGETYYSDTHLCEAKFSICKYVRLHITVSLIFLHLILQCVSSSVCLPTNSLNELNYKMYLKDILG